MPNPAAESDRATHAPKKKEVNVTTKFIVAVHGIGDQTEFGTIKSAAFRCFSYRGAPANIPLGSFHTAHLNDADAPFLDVPIDDSNQITLRFAEAYWAPVPRDLVKQGFTLEESKHWAQTVVERFRARYDRKQEEKGDSEPKLTRDDFSKVKQVLMEMIESIRILERLVMLAEKAGLFKFNLGKLLDDYVGDVQIVADFQEPRSKILERFLTVMRAVYDADQEAEIYIVAHSEGTVVSFLGLLKAMTSGGLDAGWVGRVRGYMTIGSPLDKHLLLWPELFRTYELPKGDEAARVKLTKKRVPLEQRIRWQNYYDYGDPIGFNLKKTRDWLARNEWKTAFEFEDGDDHEFSRYWLPGKAHNDYWQDKDVFGHFIQTVVKAPPEALPGKKKAPDFKNPPQSNSWASVASYGFPYLVFAILSFAAIFVLRKGVLECISPEADSGSAMQVFKSVGLSALALCGLTAMAGIFRLTRTPKWRFYGGGLFVLLMIPYWLWQWPGSEAQRRVAGLGDTYMVSNQLIVLVSILLVGAALVVVANWVAKNHPSWGLKPLLVLIGAPTAALISVIVHNQPGRGSLWPLLLSEAGAVYLWWLAALLFDLVFIWHYYVRHEAAINSLREPT